MITDKIIKNVTIDGTTFEVEYFNFNIGDNPFGLQWTLWDKITIPFYRLKGKIRDYYWQVKYAFQRMFKGYDKTETFEMFSNFIDRYRKILKDYKKHHWGYPGELTEEEWDAIVDRMIYCLDMMDEQYLEKLLLEDMSPIYTVSSKSTYEIMTKYKNEFFQMFSEWFYNLWD